MIANEPARRVKSVDKAIEIINRIQMLGGATATELTDETDISKSSVHNYLGTLETKGYVINDDGTYRLGLQFLTHGIGAKNALKTETPISDSINSVAERFSQMACWVTEAAGRGYIIERATAGNVPRYGTVGKRSYLHTDAAGKAIIALADDDFVEEICERHGLPEKTHKTITDPEELRDELETTRDRGFAVSEGEAVLGIGSIGVGFYDTHGRRHAIGIFDHSRNFAGNTIENVGYELVETVNELNIANSQGGT